MDYRFGHHFESHDHGHRGPGPHGGGGRRGEYAGEPGGPMGFGPRGMRGGPGGRGGFGFGGFRGEFMGRGQRANRGDVRNSILVLLLEEPRHGYSIIQVIEERTGGVWTPSPGSVYPTLAALEDEGLITASERDGKRVFSLTDEGRSVATSISGDTPPWEPQANDPREMMHSLRQQIGGVAAAVMQVAQNGTPDQLHRAKEMLNELRKSLYRMLAEDDTPSS